MMTQSVKCIKKPKTQQQNQKHIKSHPLIITDSE